MDKPVIVIDREQDGSIFVSLDIKDKEGRLLARVERNNVFIPPLHSYMHPRKDLHGLQVADEFGNIVFSIYYINKKAIRITGEMQFEGIRLRITDNAMYFLNTGSTWGSGTLCSQHIGLSLH